MIGRAAPSPAPTHWLVGAFLAAAMALPALAMPPEYLQGVDQAVEDLGPLNRSLRRVELGLRPDGQQTSLFRLSYAPTGPAVYGQQAYYRIGPGFRARVNRLDYATFNAEGQLAMNVTPQRDGVFAELIPANTVFELTPTPRYAGPAPVRDDWVDRRVDARVDGRVDALVDARVNGAGPNRVPNDGAMIHRRHWLDAAPDTGLPGTDRR